MDPIAEALEQANDSPADDFRFQSALNTLKRQIDGEISNEIYYNIALLDSTSADHPLLDALQGYRIWREEGDFRNGAELALGKFEEGISRALDDRWLNVATWSISVYIELADAVNHEDRVRDGVEHAANLLERDFSDLDTNEGAAGRVLDAVSEADIRSVEPETIDRLVEFCWSRSEYTKAQKNFHAERNYLRRIASIQKQFEEPVDDVNEALVGSYEDEIAFQRTRGHLVTATTIEAALNECRSFADEETLNRWRLEKREANRRGIEEEMKPIGGPVPDEAIENFNDIVESLVQYFRSTVEIQSPEVAFMGVVNAPVLLPKTNEDTTDQEGVSNSVEEASDEFPTVDVVDIFPRRHMTHEGDSVSEDASNIDARDGYGAEVRLSVGISARVLYLVIEEGLIREHHFYTLLESISGATIDDKAFLTDFIIAFFEGRHAEGVHLGMARFEALIKHQLENSGTAITGDKEGEDLPKTFGGLLNRMEEILQENYVTFLRYRFHDIVGDDMRNRIAHGDLRYKEAHYDLSASILVEIFRSSVHISEIE